MAQRQDEHSEPVLQVVNASKGGRVVAHHIDWAGTSSKRRRGLLGRDELAADKGIYLVPCQWVHTFGMRFPIDVAFLGCDGRVLAVNRSLKPNRLSRMTLRAEGVLELAAGRLRETETEVGDVLQFKDTYADSVDINGGK
jgi:uncharacterized membrane protein (UPF0127 family)